MAGAGIPEHPQAQGCPPGQGGDKVLWGDPVPPQSPLGLPWGYQPPSTHPGDTSSPLSERTPPWRGTRRFWGDESVPVPTGTPYPMCHQHLADVPNWGS